MKQFFAFVLLLQLTTCTAQNEKQSGGDKEIVCFVYHRVGDNRYPSTNIGIKTFKAHLEYLKTHDFQVLTFSDAVDYLKSGKKKQKTAVITIDDGFTSFYKNGLPLLKKYGFPATLFINTETVGGSDYMGWAEIKNARESGIEIGNHTDSHAYFLNLPKNTRYETFENEIKKVQQLVKEKTGIAPEVFAYPYGEFDAKMKAIVKEIGFKAAAAQNSGVIYEGTDLMQCPRFPMSESYAALDKFASKTQMKALRIKQETPASFLLPQNDNNPKLTLSFDHSDLQTDQLQCFIQGGVCQTNLDKKEDGVIELTVSSKTSIALRRRTLYTITVPDKSGHWHWFSHLWINPKIK